MKNSYLEERRNLALAAIASLGSAVILIATVSWPHWIELVFHADLDHGAGWLEWSIAGAAALLTLLATSRALRSARTFLGLKQSLSLAPNFEQPRQSRPVTGA